MLHRAKTEGEFNYPKRLCPAATVGVPGQASEPRQLGLAGPGRMKSRAGAIRLPYSRNSHLASKKFSRFNPHEN